MGKRYILGTLSIVVLMVTLIIVGGRGAQADIRAASGEKSVHAPTATLVVTSTADSGGGTLRWALQTAVASDTIIFDPAIFPPTNPVTIALTTGLPGIDQGNLTIDASNAGVILDGSGTPEGIDGFHIGSSDNTIKGLQILNFPSDGIEISDGPYQNNTIGGDRAVGSGPTGEGNVLSGNSDDGIEISGTGTDSNIVIGNLIGTDASGAIAHGNGGTGVRISSGASYNTIGGDTEAKRNIISGNSDGGVLIGGSSSNIVRGNFIGTDVTGTRRMPNGASGKGVWVFDGVTDNVIGGSSPNEGNLISGNDYAGIEIHGAGTTGNIVQGNYIGTDVTGAVALGNWEKGVFIFNGAQYNQIGGATAGERNIISGNDGNGVQIEGPDTDHNVVSGNYIGTDVNGTTALGNASDGVRLDDGPESNTIGGPTPGERNLISGNGRDGVELAGVHNNLVIGNYIGTDVSGMFSLGNSERGIGMNEGGRGLATTQNNIEGNLMSGNGTNGMDIYGADTVSNTVKGNLIGTDATGLSALANGGAGIWIGACAHHNKIGGHVEVDRNVISGNGSNGIRVYGEGGDCADFNQVVGNYIGVAANGLDALGNDSVGILPSNVIGTHIEGNIIANNRWGIWLSGVTSSTIRANLIGVNAAGVPAGNEYQGVYVGYYAQHNTIGGPNPTDGNVIAHNSTGVQVWSYYGETCANTISHNSIYSNTNLGIDLRGGANEDIVAPLVAMVNIAGGIASGTACANCTVEIFFDEGDQGRWYEGTTTASGTGDWSFSNGTAFIGPNVHATATDADGNTSEFSGPPPVVSSVSPAATVPGARDLGVTINGDHFRDNEPLAVDFGAGVMVTSTQFISRTQIHLYLDVDPGAALGPRDVSVTNYDGQSGTLADGFTVMAASPFPPPVVSSITPTIGLQGKLMDLTVHGQDFVDRPTVAFSSGDITVNSVTIISSTELLVNTAISDTVPAGLHDLIVTNPDGQIDTLAGAFEIQVRLFTDVSYWAGIGTRGRRGVAWGDYDNDGYVDLYVTNNNALYHNNGDGTFSDATALAGGLWSGGEGVAWGDYDNDGDLDLYATDWGTGDSLYRNAGDGTLTNVTDQAGLWDPDHGSGAAWSDYDSDGDLDLYIANMEGDPNHLYRNEGDGMFTDVTAQAQVTDTGSSRSLAWGDYDNDGDPDLYVTNFGANRLFQNQGDGTFVDRAEELEVTAESYGGGSGVAWCDYDNDGDLDLAISAGDTAVLFRNDGDIFVDESANAGVDSAGIGGEGVAWGDFDNDGWPDLYVTSHQGAALYRNRGDGTFQDVTDAAGVDSGPITFGTAWGDYDNDGDLDLFVVMGEANLETGWPDLPDILYRNGGNSNHWLHVKTVGAVSNRAGIGSRVQVVADGVSQIREVSGGSGRASQDSLPVEFGFGTYTGTVTVEVTWPNGTQQSLHDVILDQILIVTEETASISQIVPNQGTNDVPNEINVYGLNFAEGISVTLDTTPPIGLGTWRLSSSHLRATVPSGLPAGDYDLTVTNPDGGSDTLANAYTVFDAQAENDDLYAQSHDLWTDPPSIRLGAPAYLGLVVHRQGGKTTLSNVIVRFYDGNPDGGGAAIGDGTIYLLSPRSSESTTRVPWNPAASGDYVIYARIDPDNVISETVEANNTVSATITVLSPAGDITPPMVTLFTINNGAEMTAVPTVTLDVSAEDDVGGSGMGSMFFVEFEFVQAAMQWVPVQASGWLSYTTSYTWTLIPVAGVKYMQAWAADRAGNISLYPYKDRINYLLPGDWVAMGQVRLYRQYVGAGQTLTVIVNPISGDPDLYVWPPTEGAPAWVSNNSTGADQLNIVAMESGTYQIEVYGYSTAEYTISTNVSGGGMRLATKDQAIQSVNADKPLRPAPMIAVSNEPPGQMAIPAAPVTGDIHKIYLPLIMR